MSFDPFGAALGAGPLVGKAFVAFTKRSDFRNLMNEVDAALQQDHRLTPEDRDAVRVQVDGLRVNPDFLGPLGRFIVTGDLDEVPRMRAVLGERLRVSPTSDHAVVIGLVTDLFVAKAPRAMRSDRDALLHSGAVTEQRITRTIESAANQLSAQGAEQTRELEEQRRDIAALSRDITALTDAVSTRAPASTRLPAAREPLVHPEEPYGPARFIARLREHDVFAADELADRWKRGGVEGLVDLLSAPDGWLQAASGETWYAIGRIVAHHGRFNEARAAYEEAVERKVRDPVRVLARAATAARLSGDGEHGDRLLDGARDQDDAHPAVLIADADQISDNPAAVLRKLAGLAPTNAEDREHLEVVKGQALLDLGETDEAQASAERAIAAEPESPMGHALRGYSLLQRNRVLFEAYNQRVDHAELARAVADLRVGRDAMRRQRRFDVSGLFASWVVDALIVSDEPGAAQRALQAPEILDDELRSGAATHLGRQALLLGRADLALEILPAESTDEEVRLFRAAAQVRNDDRSQAAEGSAVLRELMRSTSHEPTRNYAALALLHAASDHPDIDWDNEAEAVVRVGESPALTVLKADFLELHGKHPEAENELLTAGDEPGALNALVNLALAAGDTRTAVQRAERLLEIAPDGRNRLLAARALAEHGHVEAAIAAFAALGEDASQARELREVAFERAVDLAGRRYDYATIAQVARRWLDALPESNNAAWNLAFGLARTARHDDAFELFEGRRLTTLTLERAILLAEVLWRSAPTETAVREIAAMSEEFGRQDERLEFLVLLAALRRDDELPSDLADRVRQGFTEFPSRFPESQLMWVVDAPSTAEELERFAEEHLKPGVRTTADMADAVRAGQAPVAALAAAAGRNVATAWSMLVPLPVGSTATALRDVERADAAEAIGKGAVWDSSALFISATLGPDLAARLKNALPLSHVPHAVLEDADDTQTKPERPGEPGLTMGYDPDAGRAIVTETPSARIARDADRAAALLALAQQLDVAFDADPDSDERWSRMVTDESDLPRQLGTVAATLSVAARVDLPVFSDDRFVRALARQDGLRSFGTVALLDALADREMISADERESARRVLLTIGAHGLRLSGDELMWLAREQQWSPSAPAQTALDDPVWWSEDRVEAWRQAARLLAAVYDEAPERLRDWAVVVLRGAAIALPGVDSHRRVHSLLVSSWFMPGRPVRRQNAFVQALIRALRRLPIDIAPWPPMDIPLTTIDAMLALNEHLSDDQRYRMFVGIVRRLAPLDFARAWQAFVAPRGGPRH